MNHKPLANTPNAINKKTIILAIAQTSKHQMVCILANAHNNLRFIEREREDSLFKANTFELLLLRRHSPSVFIGNVYSHRNMLACARTQYTLFTCKLVVAIDVLLSVAWLLLQYTLLCCARTNTHKYEIVGSTYDLTTHSIHRTVVYFMGHLSGLLIWTHFSLDLSNE